MDPDSRKRIRKRIIEKERNFITNINAENLLKNIWTVTYNSVVIAIVNLAFHFIMSRRLGPELYGELETLLTINYMVIMSMTAITYIIARFVSYYKSRQQYDKMMFLSHWAFVFFFMMGMTGFIITVMLSKILAGFLNIFDYSILMFFGLLVWISFLIPIMEGILRGLQEFKYMGRYKLLDASLRLALSALLIFISLQISSVIIGIVLGGAIAIVLSSHKLKKIYINRPYTINLKEIYLFAIPVFLSCIFLAALSNIDLVLVKHFFDAELAGFYAAAGMLAKTALGMAFGSAGVMFPKIVEESSDGETKKSISTLRHTLQIAVMAGIGLTAAFTIIPKHISFIIFGPQYNIHELLPKYAFAALFLSIACILMFYDLAVKKYGFIPVFGIAAFFEIVQILRQHTTVHTVLWTIMIVNALLMAFMIYYNRKELFTKYG